MLVPLSKRRRRCGPGLATQPRLPAASRALPSVQGPAQCDGGCRWFWGASDMRDCVGSLWLRTRPPASLAVAAAVNGSPAGGALGASCALEALRYAREAPHGAAKSTCVDVEVRPAPQRRTHAPQDDLTSLWESPSINRGRSDSFACRSVGIVFPWLGGLYCPHDRKLVCSANTVAKWRSCMPECDIDSAATGDRWQSARGSGDRLHRSSRAINALWLRPHP